METDLCLPNRLYRCRACGALWKCEIPGPVPTCCGNVMSEVRENTSDGAVEKHLPVIEKRDGGILVKIGSAPHPMTAEHWIMWIEVHSGGLSLRCDLHPGDLPQAFFPIPWQPGLVAGEYCNLHGFWRT